MKFLQLVILILLAGLAFAETPKGTSAIQRPKETFTVSPKIQCQKQTALGTVRQSVSQKERQKNTGSGSRLEDRKSREVQSATTKKEKSTRLSQTNDSGSVRCTNGKAKEMLRSMQASLYKEGATSRRSLSQNREKPWPIALKLQSSHRSSTGFTIPCDSSSKVSEKMVAFACAIANAEGYSVRGSIPYRYHNPGDIKFTVGYRYPGQIGIGKGGHVIFRNNAAGWAALNHQVHKMLDGSSRHYNLDMTLNQVGKKYAENWRVWAKHVAKQLHCTSSTTLREIFEIPPEVKYG